MELRDRLSMGFLARIIARPAGRAHVLRQLADAEGNGENGFFEQILSRVDDPALRRMVQKHQADELRHEQLFLACAERTGVAPAPIPDEVKFVERLFRRTRFYERPIASQRDVMEAYLLLQVIEERSVTQFRLMEPVFRAVDGASAEVLALVARDEERHLKYCHAVAARYAPDDATRLQVLAELRRVEAECFRDNGRANLEHVLAHDLFAGGPAVRLFYRALQVLPAALPTTPFAVAAPAPAPALAAAA
jgi:hypothetical protein